jgi:hypothetical protein
MQTIPISGTGRSVSFYPDDTIELVRQSIALAAGTHPDRLFMEVKTTLPKEYYSTNPNQWTELFFRMSYDGERIRPEVLKTYITQKRPGLTIVEREISKEDWDAYDESLKPIFDPDTDFDEWRILGVDPAKSFILPLPPRDLKDLPERVRPFPQIQSLFETFHGYPISEVRIALVPETATALVKLNYFPRFRPDTPNDIRTLEPTIDAARREFGRLMSLDTPKHQAVSIVRAKWYIPLISTRITAPRTRFEQIFYGLTVSKDTPYIGYFTAKTETMRHKFYVENPKEKKPFLAVPMWKGWLSSTMPQRRRPTLLLYRGTSRTSFDRIAISDKDITVDVRREKDSKESLEELRTSVAAWIQTLDAVVPFLKSTDLDAPRWDLNDLSAVATYPKEVKEFDMRRFPCLQRLFGFQNDTFRLLRAELYSSADIPADEVRAFQILTQDDAERTPEYLSEQMGIPMGRATDLLDTLARRVDEVNYDKTLKAYPTIKFSAKEVIVKFVSNLERTLHYADLLRHVLTSDAADVDDVCPRRMEKVAAAAVIPQKEIQLAVEDEADDDFNAMLGFVPTKEEEEEAPPVAEAAPTKKMRVASRAMGTYNYFNNRVRAFDPDTFDQSIYPSKCDKPKQVVVLTPADKARIGPTYDFSTAADTQKLELADPDGTAICPPYWCMRDELPLREDQLIPQEDGELHCPVCDGKVRTSDNLDTTEFSVIKRDTAALYPDVMKQVSTINKRGIPCCYQKPRASVAVLAPKDADASYVLDETSGKLSSLRFAYLSSDIAARIGVATDYAKSVKGGRLTMDATDVFRVGVGRPSKTLPLLLSDTTAIQRPRDAKSNVVQCSFFRTWAGRGPGDTPIDQIIASIDHAYQHGELTMLEELEYTTTFLKCEVIRIDTETGQVLCGFWSDTVLPGSRTIALLGKDILCEVSRKKEKKSYKLTYSADLRKGPFAAKTLPLLRERHVRACAINAPTIADAIQELQLKGTSSYEVILDPFQRIQAVLVPREVILPVQPANLKPDEGVPIRSGYSDVRPDELPTGELLRSFLSAVRNDKFKVQGEIQDTSGKTVELELASGFRVPIQPEAASAPAVPREVVQTVRTGTEAALVSGAPNAADLKLAQEIAYSSEIYEFLLFSLSKDIQTDDYSDLRRSVETKSTTLLRDLDKWFKAEAYEDSTKSAVEFVNKVRTPCGQYISKDSCNTSSLCGWHKNDCKIRVKPVVDKATVLKRIAKTLRENDKQRALVLDGRLSPFFSTVLYLEMPHELITTSI